jgi:hypothetical protein
MILIIDGIEIPLKVALTCYRDKEECQRRYGLTDKQYDKLLRKMVKAIKNLPRPAPAPASAAVSSASSGLGPSSYEPLAGYAQFESGSGVAPSPSSYLNANNELLNRRFFQDHLQPSAPHQYDQRSGGDAWKFHDQRPRQGSAFSRIFELAPASPSVPSMMPPMPTGMHSSHHGRPRANRRA